MQSEIVAANSLLVVTVATDDYLNLKDIDFSNGVTDIFNNRDALVLSGKSKFAA